VKTARAIVFWAHLAAGVTAGAVILVMSATGALLALKPQILSVIDAGVRTATPQPAGAARLSVGALIARAREAAPRAQPTGITLQSDSTQTAAVQFGRDGTIYVDPYTGRVLGPASARAQAFFRSLEDWHRWLAVSDGHRAAARSATAASNLAFLALAISGPFLWLPRIWSRSNVHAVLWFHRPRTGRARDFNWHHVVGIWCAPAIVVLTLTGVVMSYPWANAMLYRLAGSPLPLASGGGGAPPDGAARGGERREQATVLDLDGAWALAEARVPTWRSIALRLPPRGAAVSLSIVDGRSWNQFARSTLTVDASAGRVTRWEPYDASSRGQKLRGWFRFAHTGELGGLPGQAIAGLASAGGALLAWTGLALALRRLIGWRLWARLRGRTADADGDDLQLRYRARRLG
jgi:uncharacterized iron-regulated membrane protein